MRRHGYHERGAERSAGRAARPEPPQFAVEIQRKIPEARGLRDARRSSALATGRHRQASSASSAFMSIISAAVRRQMLSAEHLPLANIETLQRQRDHLRDRASTGSGAGPILVTCASVVRTSWRAPAEQVGHVFHPEGPDAGRKSSAVSCILDGAVQQGFGCPRLGLHLGERGHNWRPKPPSGNSGSDDACSPVVSRRRSADNLHHAAAAVLARRHAAAQRRAGRLRLATAHGGAGRDQEQRRRPAFRWQHLLRATRSC